MAAITGMPTKIILKASTSMTLNERFSKLKAQVEKPEQQVIRPKVVPEAKASLKNQKLLEQMARRPNVVAALKLKKKALYMAQSSIRTPAPQRLGSSSSPRGSTSTSLGSERYQQRLSAKARIGSAGTEAVSERMAEVRRMSKASLIALLRQRVQARARGGLRPRGGMRRDLTGSVLQTMVFNNRTRGAGNRVAGSRLAGRLGSQTPTSPTMRNRRGGAGGSTSPRGRPATASTSTSIRVGRGAGRGASRGMARGRGVVSRGRGAVRGRGQAPRPAATRETLDSQLDAYMKSTSSLDADLDSYMARAGQS